MIKNRKIALIGSGNIGGTLAHLIEHKKLADVVMIDHTSGIASGKSLDISQAGAIEKNDGICIGSSDYKDIDGADVVIITAGVPRKPGMSRDDLLNINANIIKEVAEHIKIHAPKAFVIVVTNPLDAMVYTFQKHSGFSPQKVVGMGGILDSGRFCHFLSMELNMSKKDISAMVMGGHGDAMVPLIGYTSVGGIPLKQLMIQGLISAEKVAAIVKRTRDGGAEIVKLLQTGSAFYAPASAAIAMAESYLMNQKRIMPCSAYLTGQYGEKDLYIGVPIVIGNHGVEKVIEIELNEEEQQMFNESVISVKELIQSLK